MLLGGSRNTNVGIGTLIEGSVKPGIEGVGIALMVCEKDNASEETVIRT